MCVPEKILTDDELPQHILQNENEYRNNQKFCDFKVIVKGVEIPVHRVVIASCGSYFDRLFSANFQENNNGFVNLDEFQADIIILLIEYMYTGKLKVSNNSVKEIFEASKYLGLEKPANFCADVLMESISVKNAIDMWRYGGNHSMHELICNDELNIFEEELFTYVIRWIKADDASRSQYLTRLVENIRIPILKPDFIYTNILENELISADLACTKYIMKSLKGFFTENITTAELILEPRTKYRNGYTKEEILIYNNGNGILNTYDHITNSCSSLLPKSVLKGNGSACANYKNNFFLAGGNENTCIYYSPVFNTWKVFYPMMENRKFHSLICANDSLYACGGEKSNTVEIFHGNQQGWIHGPPMINNRNHFGLVTVDKSIYAVGGSTATSIEYLDPRVGTWCVLCGLHNDVCAAVAIDKTIYGFHGNGAGLLDLRNNKWEPFNKSYINGSDIQSVVERDGNIYVFVYYRNTQSPFSISFQQGTIHVYNIASKKWTQSSNAFDFYGTGLSSVVLSLKK